MHPGVEIIYVPPGSASKHQPFHLGLIANAKKRHRSMLLSATIEVLQSSREADQNLGLNSGHRKWGLHEGQLAHVRDAIQLFNQSWSSVTRSSVIIFWIKIKCLCNGQVMHLNSLLTSMHGINDVDIGHSVQSIQVANESGNFIGQSVVESISESLSGYHYLSAPPKTPLYEILNEVQNMTGESGMLAVLNSPNPLDTECANQEISRDSLLSMFDESQKGNAQILSTNKDSQNDADEIGNNED